MRDATRSNHVNKASALDRQFAEGGGVVASLGAAGMRQDAKEAEQCDQVNIARRMMTAGTRRAKGIKKPPGGGFRSLLAVSEETKKASQAYQERER